MVNVKPVKLGNTERMSFGKIEEVIDMPNLLQPVFQDGILTKEYTLDEVRDNMYPEGE